MTLHIVPFINTILYKYNCNCEGGGFKGKGSKNGNAHGLLREPWCQEAVNGSRIVGVQGVYHLQ